MSLRPLHFLCRAFTVCSLGLMLVSCGSTKKTADTGGKIDNVKYFLLKDVNKVVQSGDPSIPFERDYRLYGAVSVKERTARMGNYYDVLWSVTDRSQPVKVRIEFRQAKSGLAIKTKEESIAAPKKHNVTHFTVIEDEYVKDGAVGSWRVTLLRGKEVLSQEKSYLWE